MKQIIIKQGSIETTGRKVSLHVLGRVKIILLLFLKKGTFILITFKLKEGWFTNILAQNSPNNVWSFDGFKFAAQ